MFHGSRTALDNGTVVIHGLGAPLAIGAADTAAVIAGVDLLRRRVRSLDGTLIALGVVGIAAVAITGRNQDSLDAARTEFERLVPDAQVLDLLADNGDRAVPARVAAETVRKFGRLDVLINNAQEPRSGMTVEETTWDDVQATSDSGSLATRRCMVAALPHLKDTKGSVICMSSGAGLQSVSRHAAHG